MKVLGLVGNRSSLNADYQLRFRLQAESIFAARKRRGAEFREWIEKKT